MIILENLVFGDTVLYVFKIEKNKNAKKKQRWLVG